MNQIKIEFEQVISSKEQIATLFDLLNKRLHKISCKATDYIKHESFVNAHPYRYWYLIKVRDSYVGSFYISKENTIGINVYEEYTRQVVLPIIKFVHNNCEPLPPIPSIRGGRFAINVPPKNIVLIEVLEEIGATIAQVTYFVPN